MKKLYLFAAFLFCATLAYPCVDLHPDPIDVIINIDSLNGNCDIEVRITNLEMFGGAENEFCSCAFTGFFDNYVEFEYLSFVFAGTNNPLPGFEMYTFSDAAGEEWDTADPSSLDWNGFISSVTASGIEPGIFVDLVIRFSWTSETWSCTDIGSLQEILSGGGISTDEWDPTNGTLADSHQSISFFNWDNMTFQFTPPGYFETLDNDILGFYNGIDETQGLQLSIWPNPAVDEFYIEGNISLGEIAVLNALGQRVFESYVHDKTLRIVSSAFAPGVYTVATSSGLRKKIVIK